MICTLALFRAGVFVAGLSVSGLDKNACMAWSDMWLALGYAVRREYHQPERG